MTRHNNFDALRLIAATMVLWSHMFALSGREEPEIHLHHSFGNLGVLIFFSISGYLVSASWARDPDLGRFLAKRYLRIAPALVVSMPLTAFVVHALGMWRFTGNTFHLLNGSLWTIPLEVGCYLILAGLFLLRPKFAPLLLALIALLSSRLYLRLHDAEYLAYFGLYFAMGGLLYRYPKLPRYLPLLVAGGLWLMLVNFETRLGLALIVPAIVVAIGTRSWPLLRSAGRFGDLSYGIYIYAWPVQQIVVALSPKDASYVALFVPSLAITVALAALSWHLIERPSLAAKPSPRRAVAMPAGSEVREY